MAKQTQPRANLLQGTLDMLILRTLLHGPGHGHEIGKHIQRTTNDFLQMQHGSLYPALHRMEERGWISAKWEIAPDRNRLPERESERKSKQTYRNQQLWGTSAEQNRKQSSDTEILKVEEAVRPLPVLLG